MLLWWRRTRLRTLLVSSMLLNFGSPPPQITGSQSLGGIMSGLTAIPVTKPSTSAGRMQVSGARSDSRKSLRTSQSTAVLDEVSGVMMDPGQRGKVLHSHGQSFRPAGMQGMELASNSSPSRSMPPGSISRSPHWLRQARSAPDPPFLPGGDPLCPLRQRRRQRQVDKADGCRVVVTSANRDNVIMFGLFNLLDRHVDAEQA